MSVFEKVKAFFASKQKRIAELEAENKRLDKVAFDVSQENERCLLYTSDAADE